MPDDGGPAFPSEVMQTKIMDGSSHDLRQYWLKGGMSLRDWFAGLAMQAWLTNDQAVVVLREKYGDQELLQVAVAAVACEQADALIAQLKKRMETEDADQGDVPGG